MNNTLLQNTKGHDHRGYEIKYDPNLTSEEAERKWGMSQATRVALHEAKKAKKLAKSKGDLV